MWHAYGNNILIKPKDKNKTIGNTEMYYLYGEVLDVGSKVVDIKKGDTIGFTKWGISKIVMDDGQEHFFIQDNSDFILGIKLE